MVFSATGQQEVDHAERIRISFGPEARHSCVPEQIFLGNAHAPELDRAGLGFNLPHGFLTVFVHDAQMGSRVRISPQDLGDLALEFDQFAGIVERTVRQTAVVGMNH